MGSRREQLAIRAIVVGTHAAVRSHRTLGRDELILASVQRGLALLGQFEDALPPEAAADTRAAVADAWRALEALVPADSTDGGAEVAPDASVNRLD